MKASQLIEVLITQLDSAGDRSWWFHSALKFERRFPDPPFHIFVNDRRIYLTIICPIDGEREQIPIGSVADTVSAWPFQVTSEQKAIFARELTNDSALAVGDTFNLSMNGRLGVRQRLIANLNHWAEVYKNDESAYETGQDSDLAIFISQCRSLISHIGIGNNSQSRCETLNRYARELDFVVFDFVDTERACVRVYLPTGGWETISWQYQQTKIANILRDYVGMYETKTSKRPNTEGNDDSCHSGQDSTLSGNVGANILRFIYGDDHTDPTCRKIAAEFNSELSINPINPKSDRAIARLVIGENTNDVRKKVISKLSSLVRFENKKRKSAGFPPRQR